MPYEDKYEKHESVAAPHNLIIESRAHAAVSGVVDVESFDEHEIVMATSMGTLILGGSNLRIERLSLDTGDVTVEGTIDKFEYAEAMREPGGFLGRLFR